MTKLRIRIRHLANGKTRIIKCAPYISKEERLKICRENGRKSKGPNNPHTGSLKDTQPELFKQRIMSKIDIHGLEECWLWTGAKFKAGYGRINSGGKFLRSNRVVWELFNGKIPPGMCICHTCDTPSCCNPKHLFLGTHKDNAQDCLIKGRMNPSKGEGRYNAKLSEAQALEIISSNGRVSDKEFSKLFSVHPATVRAIRTGMRWKHLHGHPRDARVLGLLV